MGRPVGYSCFGEIPLTNKRFDLYWLVVSTQYQRNGLATQLLKETEQQIKAQGANKLYIETSSLPGYSSARNFYAKHDYKEAARLVDFYKSGDDRITYCKPL
jgi:ribosomal protein S18 acetylase RimI-like enzyme